MQALQLFYNAVALHDLGVVSILSQRTEYSPEDYPQAETRTLAVRIDTWADDVGYNYDTLYANIQAARSALAVQNGVLKWISPGDTTAGDTLLERPAIVVSNDLPEDPNRHGIFSQQINIAFRYELDRTSDSGALTATVTGNGGTPVVLSLGRVLQFKDDYANNFYSEWKNIRRRSSGSLSCSGELRRELGETGAATDTRMAAVLADLEALRSQLTAGKDIDITYGPADNRVFDRTVKVESFNADIAQGPKVGTIKWNLSASYTLFPDEDGFAAAEFTSASSRDQAAGMDTLSLTGRILAGTEAFAVAKLNSVTSAMTAAYGFAATNQTRREVTKNWVNSDDSQDVNTTNDGSAVARTAFLELSFNLAYEKKAADVVTYTLTISDADDLRSGLLTRTYSGSVTASAASEDAAYNTALAQAKALGDAKHPFRVSSQETRNDRKMASQSAKEFIRLDFSYVYQLKGERTYLELTTSVNNDTFGESAENVRGYIVAKDAATATSQYQSLVLALYTGRLIRNETLDTSQQKVQIGSPWYGSESGFTAMPIRLDFNLSAYKAKEVNTYAIKYGVRVSSDYVGLTQNTTIDGQFVGAASHLTAIEAGTANPLTTFLTSIEATYGNKTGQELDYDKEKVNAGDPTTIMVKFTCQYVKVLSTEAQVLTCSMNEDVTYSGTRRVEQSNPDGVGVIQNCGTTAGSRTVTGSVVAATEAAAQAWVAKQHGALGVWQNWYGTKPADADRYEEPMQIQTGWEFVPLTDGSAGTGTNRGTGMNFKAVSKQFTFREIVPSLPSPF